MPTPFLILFFAILQSVQSQTTEIPNFKDIQSDEASVLTSILQIVDRKFDTLSMRISSMENAVNGLQFYSLRQFKIINTNLQGVSSFIQGVHGQMSQLDINSRAAKISVDILDQDITEYTESNKQVLEDMSKGMIGIDKSIHEKTDMIRQAIEVMEEKISKNIVVSNSVPTTNKPLSPSKSLQMCNFNSSRLERHIDIRISDLKKFASREISHISNMSSIMAAILEQKHRAPENLKTENNANNLDALPEEKGESNSRNSDCSVLENERLFKALSNMTANIVQSVSYFRHTGGLFEEIITNTDSIAQDQTKIFQELSDLMSNLQSQNLSNTEKVIEQATIATAEENAPKTFCPFTLKEFKDIVILSKNETKLLEVVTQLVLNTSVSLSNTLVELQDEIFRLKEVGVKISEVRDERRTFDSTHILLDLLNQTKLTYKMIRVIASNTGWMPHTFQRVGLVGEQLNKSLQITQNLYGDFSNIFDIKPVSDKERNIAQPLVERTLNRRAQTAYGGHHYVPKGNLTSSPSSPLLNLIFDTNKQLKRIMPALTRLIAEPEPLITLVSGETETEGRLEVYFNGQWGTMCGPNLNNDQASIICRTLGYFGGIANGRGSFGPGSGGFLAFNKTCIRSHMDCPFVTQRVELSHCNHAEDLGIICDHMIRVVDNDGFISRSRGRLQLHHKGRWRPVCSRGWTESEVRTACRQLGYMDGRLINGGEVWRGMDNLFVSNILCEKEDDILHTCDNKQWMMSKCKGYLPVALACR